MILCAGEALVDMIPCQSRTGHDCFAPHAGGAVFNTAIALGRLEIQAGLVAGLSSDLFGNLLRDTLRASNVSLDTAVTRDLPTTLAFVSIVDGQAKYAFYDENTAGSTLTPDQLPGIPDRVSAAFLGGISLIAEPCGSTFEALALQLCRKAVVMIDPNVRPAFITDEAAYRSRLDRLWPGADIVKLSDEDIAWLAGRTVSTEDYSHRLLKQGVKLVIVTSGGKGSVGHTTNFTVRVPARHASVVDTVGAGDAFNAGVLASFSRQHRLSKPALTNLSGTELQAALVLGSSVAAASVSRQGADPPWLHEIAELESR